MENFGSESLEKQFPENQELISERAAKAYQLADILTLLLHEKIIDESYFYLLLKDFLAQNKLNGEDRMLASPIAAVFDGVGGNGFEAAEFAKKWFGNQERKPPHSDHSSDYANWFLRMQKGLKIGIEAPQKERGSRLNTTLVLSLPMLHHIDGSCVITCSVGDSSALLFRKRSEPVYLNHCDSTVEFDAESEGKLSPEERRVLDNLDASRLHLLSPRLLRAWKSRHVILHAATSDIRVQSVGNYITRFRVESGDVVLLATDGVTDNVTLDSLNSIIDTSSNLQQAIREITLLAGKIMVRTSDTERYHIRSKLDDIAMSAFRIK